MSTAGEAAERAALQLPPRRAAKSVKMATISRAEGGQLQAPVGPGAVWVRDSMPSEASRLFWHRLFPSNLAIIMAF